MSGVGPLAGSDVLAKVYKNAAALYGAVADSQYPDLVLMNHGIEGVDNTGALNDTFEKEIVCMVRGLESRGSTIVGIACNTAHIYLHKIKTKPTTILVNLIEAVASEASKTDMTYLLLTSDASKKQRLYHGYLERHGVDFRQTNAEQQALLDEAIGLVMAYKLDAAGELLQVVLRSAADAGFAAIIAGCTELPIAIGHCKETYGLAIVDSNDVLARTLISHYYSSKGKT